MTLKKRLVGSTISLVRYGTASLLVGTGMPLVPATEILVVQANEIAVPYLINSKVLNYNKSSFYVSVTRVQF